MLRDVSGGPPGEGVVAPAVSQVDLIGADLHADSVGLVVDRDDPKVGAEFGSVGLLRAD